jgi:hypothetical protein
MDTKNFILYSLLNSFDFVCKIERTLRPFSLQQFTLYFNSSIENNEPKIKCKILWFDSDKQRWMDVKDFSTFDELLNNLLITINENNELINKNKVNQ